MLEQNVSNRLGGLVSKGRAPIEAAFQSSTIPRVGRDMRQEKK